MTKKSLLWFRQDLRLTDNLALVEAAQFGEVLPVFIYDENCERKIGGASKWWLHHSLQSLNQSINNNLNFYFGDELEILLKLISDNNIEAVFWNRCYEPQRIERDTKIKQILKDKNILVKSFNSSLLWEPAEITKDDKTPYKVFTPFYRRGCLSKDLPRKPLPAPENVKFIKDLTNPTKLENFAFLPKINWYQEMQKTWQIGENAAQKKLQNFLDFGINGYKELRNFPAKKNVSQLSAYIHFGEISVNQIWWSANAKFFDDAKNNDLDQFLSELGWREFSYNLLFNFRELAEKNFQEKFDKFPWLEMDENGQKLLQAWQKGQTGYPIVDAGMRELWQTGYMHNRVRMIVGSFLVKNLLLDWRHGERWFWDCLVDADLANNSASWQWVAGSGADAAPYFRIFNPVLQGEKFDPEGEYTLKYVPELKNLPKKYLYKPWEADKLTLKGAGVELGKNYPMPIVDMNKSRDQALIAYQVISKQNQSS